MNLLEYQAKALLDRYNVPVPDSFEVFSDTPVPDSLSYPRVAKSQVPVGGRGKAGGIVVVENPEELGGTLNHLFKLPIKGHLPSVVLLEEKLDASRELYLALRLNRDARALEWLVSAKGGVDIESNADSVFSCSLDEKQAVASRLNVELTALLPLLDSLENLFKTTDLLLLEINPLVEQVDGTLVCADAKVLVDDNARFRQPDLPWPPQQGNRPKPLGGTIGCIANGAGMAMSTMDTIVAMGGKPANFLDIGGGTGEKEFVIALQAVKDLPDVQSIVINIFAGISRCDEIARGIIAAREQLPDLPPLFIRLEGTNRDIAARLLGDANIPIETDLQTCVQKAMEVTG